MQGQRSKTRIPCQKRGLETREKIVFAALEMFSEKGYHSTNSKEIAARAGVAIGSFYAYFNDKKELFAEAFKMFCSLIEEKVCELDQVNNSESRADNINYMDIIREQVLACEDIHSQIRTILEKLFTAHQIFPGFQREITVMRLLDSDIREAIDERERTDIANLVTLFRSMKKITRVDDIEAAAFILLRSIDIVIPGIDFVKSMQDHKNRIIDAMTDMIYRYLFCNE